MRLCDWYIDLVVRTSNKMHIKYGLEIHLKYGPDVSLDFVSGNIRPLGKQN